MSAVYVWDNEHLRTTDLSCSDNYNIISPHHIQSLDNAVIQSISSGQNHSLVCVQDGAVYRCTHIVQQFGNESILTNLDCVKYLPAQKVIQVAAGFSHSIILTEAHKVYSWGQNDKGQLGRTTNKKNSWKHPKLVHFSIGHPVLQISCGNNHTLALTDDGLVFAWGSNSYGQLGLGSITDSHKDVLPEVVSYLRGIPVLQVTAGGNHSFILSKSGTVYGWGRNDLGQLGLSNTINYYWPRKCSLLKDQKIKYICCGENHTACLTKDGRVFTFGAGSHSQLGHCSSDDENIPKQVMELSDIEVSQIACGSHHTLAYVPTSDRLYVFGLQRSEQLELSKTESSDFVLSSGSHSSHLIIDNKVPECKIKSIHAGGNQSYVIVVHGGILDSDDFRKEDPPERQILTLSQERIRVMLQNLSPTDTPSNEFCLEIEKIFSSAACLNGSFLLPNDEHYGTDSNKHGVNMDAVREFFQGLAKSPKLLKLIRTKIEKELLPLMPTSLPEALRLYLILPECHIFDQPELYSSIICLFAQSFKDLNNKAKEVFDSWWPSDHSSFKRLVMIYKQCMQYLLQLPCSNSSKHRKRNEGLCLSMEMLEKLYQVNEANNIIDSTTFIVPDLKNKVDIENNYKLWKLSSAGIPMQMYKQFDKYLRQLLDAANSSKYGSTYNKEDLQFCNYPFLLDSETKSILLQTDASFQKRRIITNACLQQPNNPDASMFLLSIKRESIVSDTFSKLHSAEVQDFKKQFVEFFRLFFREVMDPDFGMFTTDEQSRLLWFSSKTKQESELFHIIGILCGLVIYQSLPIDLHFPLALYKKLLKKHNANSEERLCSFFGLANAAQGSATLDDLKELMPDVGRGLQDLLDYDGDESENIFDLTFVCGATIDSSNELCPGGAERLVDQNNKREYVDLYVDYCINKSVKVQFDVFSQGFHGVCGGKILESFRPEELQSLTEGNDDYDFTELEENTTYREPYKRDHPTIVHFWEVFHEMSLTNKKNFLLFMTGSDRIPITGMKNIRISIQPLDKGKSYLPEVLTCHKLLCLPRYRTKQQLESKLLMAIQKTEGFLMNLY